MLPTIRSFSDKKVIVRDNVFYNIRLNQLESIFFYITIKNLVSIIAIILFKQNMLTELNSIKRLLEADFDTPVNLKLMDYNLNGDEVYKIVE